MYNLSLLRQNRIVIVSVAEGKVPIALGGDGWGSTAPMTATRRIENEEGESDEIFSRDLKWEFSPLLYAAERGDTMLDFVPISEEEASRIVERIRVLADPDE
jgi:hypothetical protein